jgi:hypothetical protein
MRDNNITLGILQYNTHKSRKYVMIPFLTDPRVQNYDIIAVQEPWRNPKMSITYRSRNVGFYLTYKLDPSTRVCFYISFKFNVNDWSVEFPIPDVYSLHIQLEHHLLHIHNVYNPFPQSYRRVSVGSLRTLKD